MSPVLAITMLFFAIVGGIIGWRRASRPVNRRSAVDADSPAGMSQQDYDGLVRRRRRLWRLFVTLLYGVIGAVAALVLLFIFRR